MLYWIFVVFLIYILFVLLQKIFGGSLGFEDLMIALLVTNLGYSFYLGNRLNHHLGACIVLEQRRRKD